MLIDDSPVGQSRVRAVGNDLVYCPINFDLDIAVFGVCVEVVCCQEEGQVVWRHMGITAFRDKIC
jgi:hypothetical protein